MRDMESDLNSMNLGFVEELYESYLKNPQEIPADWRQFFEGLDDSRRAAPNGLAPRFRPASLFNPPAPRNGNGAPAVASTPAADFAARVERLVGLQHRVDKMIRNFRARGHIIADINPLSLPKHEPPELDPAYYQFTEREMDMPFKGAFPGGMHTLRKILQRMRATYCGAIGVQFMHIDDLTVREWLQARMESTENRLELSRDEQLRILTRLTDAVMFEEFIQKKYLGAKRFSLEGAETLIPLLDMAIEKASQQGVSEIVIGMAHRGRLNVLSNIMGKSAHDIFLEFEDKDPELYRGRGDVKYHQGFHGDWTTAAGKTVHLALCFNPSHLEFVNPVALGRTRARQDRENDVDREKAMTFLIHGDASFAGEGVVQETLNLSQLEGYSTGGALHIILDNQLGFTTMPREGRSSLYATAIAKMLQIPIFHINGEDPEAVGQVIHMALDFRSRFKRDVVVDMKCYRKHGHNETDEPEFTNPRMYQLIRARKSVREAYLDRLLALGGVTAAEAEEIEVRRREALERDLSIARRDGSRTFKKPKGIWTNYKGGPDHSVKDVDTGVAKEILVRLLKRMSDIPEDFTPHPKLEPLLKRRLEMADGAQPLDWAAAELLAYATLAVEGCRVRLSGQDSVRGTFSHRHAMFYDCENGRRYAPLQNLARNQAPVEIINSPLSEAGVLGFDYGYSLGWPDGLVVWEAQFGDFINAAQVYIDQFIVSAEDKWGSLSGLTLLLPHGFEGMGPEHSSARPERFLELAAEDNIQIANPTTPAQFFHLLRRQVVRPWRKPLIVLTPKSLLRHPRVKSSLDEFTQGSFQRILPDDRPVKATAAKRVILCSGKIYYELLEEREKRQCETVAILRFEQLYPLSDAMIAQALRPYDRAAGVYWVQEEPANMGAARHLRNRFHCALFGRSLRVISRPESGSPATGSASAHKIEQQDLLDEAFRGL